MAQLAHNDSKGGNTNPPSQTKEKRISASEYWCFTYNNYPDNWMALMAPGLEGCKWIAEHEVGDGTEGVPEGTPHLQGYVEFPLKVRPIGYKGFPKQISWRKRKDKATREHNTEYCSKDFREGKTKELFGNLKPKRRIRFPTFDRDWQVEILELIKQEPDDRSIYWYWSNAGNIGKTTFSKYLCVEKEACLLSGKGADVRNGALTFKKDIGRYPDLCVFPIPRSFNSEYLSYEAMENVKDALFYSGKYEGGTVADPCCHLIVMANFPPDETRMSADRWIVRNIDPPEDSSQEGLRPPASGSPHKKMRLV